MIICKIEVCYERTKKISAPILVAFIILLSVFSETTYSAAAAKTNQIITFGSLPTLVANGTASLTATASSGLVVTFKSLTATICRLTGSTVSAVAAGTCKIAANQAGSSTYKAAKQVTQNIVIAKLSQTITYLDVSSIVVKGNVTVSFSSSSGLPVSLKSLTPTICSISGSKVIGKKAGVCKIAGNVASNKVYSAATQVIQQITVSTSVKTSQTITFGIAPSIVVGGTATVSASATSSLPVTLTSTTSTICSISGTTVTAIAEGTCTIAANQAGNSSFNAATQITQSFSISSNKLQLKNNIGTVYGKYLTAGNAENLNKIVSANSRFSEFLENISNLILPQAHATIQACSTFVGHSGIENQSWDVINLVQTGTQTACVEQVQDAGRYIVLAPKNLQQADGSPCDLVTIEKTSGNTACIYLSLPNRATTGDLLFYLGANPIGIIPGGQLSLNGNYFFIGFYNGNIPNGSLGYVGHLRLDFTSAVPNSLITQLHYGNLDNFQGSQEVTIEGGKIYSIFSELLPTENGDYIYTKTDQTDKSTNSNGIPIALIRDYTYVVVDPLQSDPSLQKTVPYIRSLNGADGSTYGININESPVGLWWKTQMQTDVAEMSYGGQIIPNPAIVSSSPTHRDFYFPIFPVNYADPICGNQIDQIIKATIVTATGEISFERIGPFGLGNGAGRHRLTDNIFLSSDLSTYFSLYISANPPSGELTMLKRTNGLSSSSCPYIETTIYSEPYSAGTISPHNASLSFETAEGVFLMNISESIFGDSSGYGFSCDWNSGKGCQFTGSSVILYYDKSNATVTSVPLTRFNSLDYSLSMDIAPSIRSDRLSVQILDATNGRLKYTADLTPTGFEGIIEYADPSALQTDVVSGF